MHPSDNLRGRCAVLVLALLFGLAARPAGAADDRQAALDFAQRLREDGPFTRDEREWVVKFRREKRMTNEQLADHVLRCWDRSEEIEANPEARQRRLRQQKERPRAAPPLGYAWQRPVGFSLAIGAAILGAILLVHRLRERIRWSRSLQGTGDGASVSELVSAQPVAENDTPPDAPGRPGAPPQP